MIYALNYAYYNQFAKYIYSKDIIITNKLDKHTMSSIIMISHLKVAYYAAPM